MSLTQQQLHNAFVAPGHIPEEVFASICAQSEAEHISIEEALIAQAPLKSSDLGRGLADAYGVPFSMLGEQSISLETLSFIPESVARAQQTVFYDIQKDQALVATSHPDNHAFLNTLSQKTARPVSIRYALPAEIEVALHGYQGDLAERFAHITENGDTDDKDQHTQQGIDLVNLLLRSAFDAGSSDIHIEPFSEGGVVRFRIDGLLKIVTRHSKAVHEKIVARLKILSGLRTDEHAAPQDGRFSFDAGGGRTFDLRVSLAPITDGENLVLRILRRDVHTVTLEEIGLSEEHQALLRAMVQKSHGMVLTVGPTGAGKTTTLYTLLKTISTEERNIMTIEDPVEYNIDFVQQIQVNQAKDVRFDTGLRTIVRQDPDVILVGEIRDQETAKIAVNAAMTGHLLLSTLHTNDAATTFPRLAEMGIEAFLVASSVNVVVAQRLMRKLCDSCRKSATLDQTSVEALKLSPMIHKELVAQSGKEDVTDILLYESSGCSVCNNLGYRGRIGVFEVLQVTDTIRSLILKGASAYEIDATAQAEGMRSMSSDGVTKILAGISSLDELLRVVHT
ncbi:MAG: Type II secretory pathway, ATPase PulE/tfp pilus assembly pathway, ATPase PilB [Parcubacteria group bacterium GW2011_GWA2_43_11]|nr:MAG: Type II secretory pathway, ATPase PulE/tfp pilus assembly pathway, ATPase PilB [Parcubacteria group bacterium GW2011_GWA2_43_11]